MQAKLHGLTGEVAPTHDTEDAADRIVEAIGTSGAKFVVMPAPYLENIGQLGRDSVGSTAERVLARAHVPVLFVREPQAGTPAALSHPLIKLHVRQAEAADSLAWAFALAGKSGDYRVMFVVDATAMAEAMALLGQEFDASKLTDQVLLDDAQAAAGSLVAAAQHWASASGARLVVDFKIGSDPDVTARAGNDEGRMLVIPCPADRNTGGYSRALTVLRLSRVPVLMI
jgi:nucleotide-binding universal stress UspA family protein